MSRIVVGVDGSEPSRAALRWAVEEARLREVECEAVLVYPPPGVPMFFDPMLGTDLATPPPPEQADEAHQRAESTLARIVEDEIGEDRDAVTRTVVAHRDPADGLLQTAQGADLLIVGSRGVGGFRGLLLGSVSGKCVHHGTCPVAVIHGEDRHV